MIPVLIMLLLALVSPSIEMSTLDENEPVQTTSGARVASMSIAVDIRLKTSLNTILLSLPSM